MINDCKNIIDDLRNYLMSDFDFHNQPSNYASHNFHSFPAKFPPQIPRSFIQNFSKAGDIILDPMVGSGTTTLESYLLDRRGIGFDIDPLALLISKVKTTYISAQDVLNAMKVVTTNATKRLNSQYNFNDINQFFDDQTRKFLDTWFLPKTQVELFLISNEIQNIQDNGVRDFLTVAFSSIIITKSGGVSLAIDLGHTRPHLPKKAIDIYGDTIYGNSDIEYPPYSIKVIRSAITEFEKKCLANIKGLIQDEIRKYPTIHQFGDAQSLPLEENSIDLIVTSPPYASNAIDYMRAHKFSLVWLGYSISGLSDRRSTYIGGEATENFSFNNLPEYPKLIIDRLMLIDKKKGKVLNRYFSEMSSVITEFYRVLKKNKIAFIVIGNSTIKGLDTRIPDCLAEIGKSIGFSVPAIGSRQLDRNKRMLPVAIDPNLSSVIQQRMHEEYLIGFYKK